MKYKIPLLHAVLVLLVFVFSVSGSPAAERPEQISYWGIVIVDAGGRGVEIFGLKNDSPAGTAGLKTSDILLSVNGTAVRSVQEFRDLKNTFPLYTPLNLKLNRNGALLERQIVLSGIVPLNVKTVKTELTIPGVPPLPPATALSAIDTLEAVNVLDQVIRDPKSGKIAIIGHYDARFNTGQIPYLDILKTAMTYPQPALNLKPVSSSIKEKNTEITTARQQLWNWPEKEFILAHPDLELERQLLIRYWASACGLSPQELVSLFNYINFSAKEVVPPSEIRAIQGKALRHLGFVDTAQAYDLVNQTGVDAPLKALQLLGRNAEGQSILARSGGDAAGARGSLTASVYLAMLEKIYVSEATVTALRDDLTQGRSAWQEIVKKSQGQMMPSRLNADKRDIVMTALNKITLSTKASRALLKQPLNDRLTRIETINLPQTTQLTRILYEADYSLKSILIMPQLFHHIEGSRSIQEYESYKGKGYIDKSDVKTSTNHWLEPKAVGMTVSPQGRVVSFGSAEMQYNARFARDDDGSTVIDVPEFNHYYDEWTRVVMDNYDEYARIMPAFHKIREAAKIIALANWLIAEKIPVDLGGVRQERWDAPDRLAGFWRVGLVYAQKGDEPDVHNDSDKLQFAYTGGVTFKKSNWTQMTPSATSDTEVTRQLILSASLGQKAVQEAQNGNLENARHLAELSAQAMNGSLSKKDLARINIPAPQVSPVPISPEGVQLQKELLKATNAQIKGLTLSSDAGKRKAALNLLNTVYENVRAKPVEASDYLLKLQTGQLYADSAPTAKILPPGIASSQLVLQEQYEFETRNAEWMEKQKQLIEQRLKEPNKYASAIYKSLKTNAPPLPGKAFNELQPGDVLLIEGEGLSKGISYLDNKLSSGDNTSRASHTVIYLKEVNGKKLFLDNQPFEGPRIISEEEFLRLYGPRGVDVAKLAQPLNEKEAKALFSAAVEMAQKNRREIINNSFAAPLLDTNYGLVGKENVVCSEADWALLKATGRTIPHSADMLKLGLSINFSPADFYNSPYFLVTPLW